MSIDADNLPDFLVRRREAMTFSDGFAGRQGSFAAWRSGGLALLRAAVGTALAGEASVSECARHERQTGVGLRMRAAFPTGAMTDALMLLPPGLGPHPAVLLLHDHGSDFGIGKEKVVTPWDDPPRAAAAAAWQLRFYDGISLGHALVSRSFVVLAADSLGWGSRQGNGYAEQQALAANLMQFGLSFAGLIAAEDAQLARWLARHPKVDAQRVGVLGFSFGGYRAWQTAALCPEVAAGVAAGWVGRFRDLMQPGGNQLRGQSAFCMLHAGLGGRLDYPNVAGLAAPKPMLFMSGRSDAHFPPPVASAAFRDLHRIWRASGSPSALKTRLDDAGHVFTAGQLAQALAFLERSLRVTARSRHTTERTE